MQLLERLFTSVAETVPMAMLMVDKEADEETDARGANAHPANRKLYHRSVRIEKPR